MSDEAVKVDQDTVWLNRNQMMQVFLIEIWKKRYKGQKRILKKWYYNLFMSLKKWNHVVLRKYDYKG